MRTELFKNKIFFYIFLLIVGIDFINALFQISKPTDLTGILILKIVKIIIDILAILMFFIKTNHNHSVFKLFIYFVCIFLPLFPLLYALKTMIPYGINPISNQKEIGVSLIFGFVLLLFYNIFKIENNSSN
ncbi:MAG: hypothetical protein LBE36_04020 [Flavobacteriaceae bacterium]|jgi:hypothetical protein|nr:hypothetical protein [Flavobacteriaceae bacterium]